MTNQELADRMRVSEPYVSQIKKQPVTKKLVEKVAAALKVSPRKFDCYHVAALRYDFDRGDTLALAAVQLMARYYGLSRDARRGYLHVLQTLARA